MKRIPNDKRETTVCRNPEEILLPVVLRFENEIRQHYFPDGTAKKMACVLCGTEKGLIFLPHAGAEATAGLLISCLDCQEALAGSKITIEQRPK